MYTLFYSRRTAFLFNIYYLRNALLLLCSLLIAPHLRQIKIVSSRRHPALRSSYFEFEPFLRLYELRFCVPTIEKSVGKKMFTTVGVGRKKYLLSSLIDLSFCNLRALFTHKVGMKITKLAGVCTDKHCSTVFISTKKCTVNNDRS